MSTPDPGTHDPGTMRGAHHGMPNSADVPYRDFVEQMQDGAVVLTGNGNILYANARFSALVGEPLEAVVGGRIIRFVSVSDRADVEILLHAGSGRGRCRLIGASSGEFAVSLSLTTTSPANGERRLNLVVTDPGERDRRREAEFLAEIAHELRTPVGAIGHALRVLESEQATSEPVALARRAIGRQIGHISRLACDLLDAERAISGKLQLQRQLLDLAEVVREAVETFTADPGLDRHIEISADPVWVDADAVRLEQVLLNLLGNALKYTPPDGRIRVAVRAEDGDAVLSVEDTGMGISPRLLAFIFDPYVQANRTLDYSQGGLGIGLALVRRLVELHGGTVAASSEGEGHGSRFIVRLKQVSPAREAGARPSDQPERRAKPRRVLLIEDSRDAREMLSMVLQLAGHEVHSAADGIDGLGLLDVVRPHVGIIDISLPRMNGYQVARRIRERPDGAAMLLLALSGHDAPGDVKRSTESGFDHHLVKPVDLDHLRGLIRGRGAA